MQRFLISVFAATGLSWILLLIFASKIGDAGILQDFIFTIFLFLAASFTISLILYFARIVISSFGARSKIKFEEEAFVNMRPLYRRSFKMATVISAFIAILAFLKLEELLNLFNLSLVLAIVILGSIWLRR